MKKRVKLFTTIASLCLAVALMAFGVYAATQASFKITGSVTFTASKDVYVALAEENAVTYAQGSTLNETAAANITGATTLEGTLSNADWATVDAAGAPLATVTEGTLTNLNYAFKTAAQNDGTAVYAYKVVVKFVATHAMSNLTITLTNSGEHTNVNYAASATCGGEAVTSGSPITTVAKDAEIIVTVVVSLKDTAVQVDATEYSTTIGFEVA